MIRRLLVLASVLTWPVALPAQQFHVRADAPAGGNGTDWDRAFRALPAALMRGATYYVARGAYPGYLCDDPESGAQVITIRRATAGDHGSDAGWRAEYGQGQAIFTANSGNPFTFASDYWVIDGMMRNEANWADRNTYGFLATVTGDSENTSIWLIGAQSNITIRYCYGYYPAVSPAYESLHNHGVKGGGNSNILVERCGIENTSWKASFLLNDGGSNGPIELRHNYVANACNKELLSARRTRNLTFAYNRCVNMAGTGIIVFDGAVNWRIHGNLFWSPDSSYRLSDGLITTWTGKGQSATNVLVYGNTFVNLHGAGRIGSDAGSGNAAFNNLFFGVAPGFANMSSGFNVVTNDPTIFVSADTGDFRLARPTQACAPLADIYRTDMAGAVRGTDGTWDAGAYEFVGAGQPPQSPPSAPSGLNIAGQ